MVEGRDGAQGIGVLAGVVGTEVAEIITGGVSPALGVAKSRLTLIRGQSARDKVFRLD